MTFIIVIITIMFTSGLVLVVWSVLNDAINRSQKLQSPRFLRWIEKVGNFLVFVSLLIPTIYVARQFTSTQQFWIVGLALTIGLLLIIFVTTGMCLKIGKMIIVITRLPLTNLANEVINGIIYFIMQIGFLLVVIGFTSLVVFLLK